MGKSSSPPATPDPYAVAQAQGAMNEDTARVQGRLNNPNVSTPFGSQTVSWGEGQFNQPEYQRNLDSFNQYGYWGPGSSKTAPTEQDFTSYADQPTITQTLAPEQQTLVDQNSRISGQLGGMAETGLGRVENAISQPFDVSGAPQMATSVQAGQLPTMEQFGPDRDRIEQALYSRLEPQLQRDEESLQQRLANQGLTAGSEAYGADVDAFGRQKNDLRMQTVLAGAQEQQRLYDAALRGQGQEFGQGLSNANLANQGRQQSIQEQAFMRNLPINEISALRSGSQVNLPQFQPYQGSNVGQTPLSQSVYNSYQGDLGAYNTQVGSQNAQTQGIASLAGTAALAFAL